MVRRMEEGSNGANRVMKQDGNVLAILSILISVIVSVVGQLLVKKGLNLIGNIQYSKGVIASFSKIFWSPYVLVGTFIYFLGVFFWLYALVKVDLSFAYPFSALSYVLVLLLSWLFLGENIPSLRLIGVLVICFGVIIVSKS
jgi:drug/metabolite transporter (DMT)-like permease